MPQQPDIGFALDLPPQQAIEYFRDKGWQVTFRWREMIGSAHNKAFTAAGIMKMDILQDIRDSVDSAIAEGKTFRQFQDELEPTLRRKGWWGKKEILDEATGEVRDIDINPHRIRNIYRTNMQTSYQSGRYKQQEAMKDSRPYWMYVAVMDQNTRPSHKARNRTVYRADDSIWNWMYPPNDWGCRCRVRTLSQRRLERMGLKVHDGKEAGKFTGEGWDYNPGQSDTNEFSPKPGSQSFALVESAYESYSEIEPVDYPDALILPSISDEGRSKSWYVDQFIAYFDEDPEETQGFSYQDQTGMPVAISRGMFQTGSSMIIPDNGNERHTLLLADTIREPAEIRLLWNDAGRITRRFLKSYSGADGLISVAIDFQPDSWEPRLIEGGITEDLSRGKVLFNRD